MDKAEMIRNWCLENTEPIQALCPKLVQYWRDSKGYTISWDNKTGKRNNQTYEETRRGLSVRKFYYGTYLRYIPELDVLEISGLELTGGRGEDGIPKNWRYGREWRYGTGHSDRIFLFRNELTAYSSVGEELTESKKKYVNSAVLEFIKGLRNTLCQEVSITELNKFAGTDIKSNYWGNSYTFQNWYENSFMERKAHKNAFVLDYELEDEKIEQKTDAPNVITFTKLDDNWGVIRYYRNDTVIWCNSSNGGPRREYSSELDERTRVFINAKGKVTTVSKNKYGYSDKWEIKTGASYSDYYCNQRTEVIDEEKFLEWKPLKYILPVIEDKTIDKIVTTLRHPIVEQLVKAGYKNIAKEIIRADEVAANLKKFFGVKSERKLPLYKLLGVNKEALRVLENDLNENNIAGRYYSTSHYSRIFITEMKQLYGRDDISDLSKETIQMFYNGLKSCNESFYSIVTGRYYYWRRSGDPDYVYSDDERKLITKLFKAEEKHEGIIRLYKDVTNIYDRIRNKPEIDIKKFDSYSDLQRMHDAFIEIQNTEEAERRAYYDAQEKERMEMLQKKFEKLQDERESKYNYQEDTSEFCVIVPKELKDITKEGISLHHCVGSYVQKHAMGETNILFLRRKNEIDKSFYTIEIKGNEVMQIHGNHNQWLGNNPEAIPFVYRYFNQLGVRFNKHILLNLGAGYGASKESLDESYLTKVA